MLYLTGMAEVIWAGPEVAGYSGAERLMRFRMTGGYRAEVRVPWRWSMSTFSPSLKDTGVW
ncbi:MAG: hypothetical protein AAFO84_11380 [Cyanobacteria bacterium J06598_1]